MRRIRAIFLMLFVFLAACQQTPPPVATLTTGLGTAAAESVNATSPAAGQPQITPGTLIPPATPDPLAGTPFDRIVFTRSGGIAGQTLTVEVSSDGTVTRNSVTSRISSQQVKQLQSTLDQIEFFGLQGVFTSTGPGADRYQYQVTVDRLGVSRTIDAMDGFTPPELMALFSMLAQLGAP